MFSTAEQPGWKDP